MQTLLAICMGKGVMFGGGYRRKSLVMNGSFGRNADC
jgi:hypothetical protein